MNGEARTVDMLEGWYERRARCSECGWDGLEAELQWFAWQCKRRPQCPKCHAKWETGRNVSYRPSAILHYGVHAACGQRHRYGTECRVKKGE